MWTCAQDITSEDLAKIVSHALELRVGKGRRYSCEDVAKHAGIAKRTVEDHKAGTSAPTTLHFLKYALFFGPDFAADVFKHIGQHVIDGEDADGAKAAELAAVVRRIAPDLERLRELSGEGER